LVILSGAQGWWTLLGRERIKVSALRCIAKKIAIAKNIAMHRNLSVVGCCAIRFGHLRATSSALT
jgi:hypothetical protein